MTFDRKSFLLATWEAGGSVAPFITVARKLIGAGHQVRIVSDICNRDEALAVGADFSPWNRAPNRAARGRDHEPFKDWEVPAGVESFSLLLDGMIVGSALDFAKDVIEVLDQHPSDLVVANDLLFGVLMGCEAHGQACAVLACNTLSFPLVEGIPPLGPGFPPAVTEDEKLLHAEIGRGTMELLDARLPIYNAMRAELALPPLAHLTDQLFVADRFLLGTSRAFDFAVEDMPAFYSYVGPQLDDNRWSDDWVSPFAANDRRPLVLVAFSTTFQNHAGVLQNIVDALSLLNVRGVVTLGGSLQRDEVRGTDNVAVVASAPHNELLREASLLITHGGHGTMLKGVMAGVPSLILPHGRDQADNAIRVAHRGAGIILEPTSPAGAIRAALVQLLEDPSYIEAAAALSTRVRQEFDPCRVVTELTELASGSAGQEVCKIA